MWAYRYPYVLNFSIWPGAVFHELKDVLNLRFSCGFHKVFQGCNLKDSCLLKINH